MDIEAFGRKATKKLGRRILKVLRAKSLLRVAGTNGNEDTRRLRPRRQIEQERDSGLLRGQR